MAITHDTSAVEKFFIFRSKEILVKKNSSTNFELPDADFFERIAREQKSCGTLCDSICETPQNYAAALLLENYENAATDFAEFEFIPFREFCFVEKNVAALACRAKGVVSWHDTYRHCPKCGALFCTDKLETALVCAKCGFKLFPRIEPCVIVRIHRGDEILLVRNKHFGAKFFSHISGFVELGESAETAVRREAMEEVGLELKNIQPVATQTWPFPDQLMLAYRADFAGGKMVLQEDEIAEARWFKKNELPDSELLRGSVAWRLLFELME